MPDRYFNPFQAIDINIPTEFHEAYGRYSQTGGNTVIDQSPFPRMVDLWFLAICVAVRLGLEPTDIGKNKTTKIIEGSIFSSDSWRVDTLMLIAIGMTGEVQIVSEPREMMKLANGLAATGLPKVIEMLKDGDAEPIWNLSDEIDNRLCENTATAGWELVNWFWVPDDVWYNASWHISLVKTVPSFCFCPILWTTTWGRTTRSVSWMHLSTALTLRRLDSSAYGPTTRAVQVTIPRIC